MVKMGNWNDEKLLKIQAYCYINGYGILWNDYYQEESK